jgi:dipeptidyl aminopeptidase/acylaminoacyl peptidase
VQRGPFEQNPAGNVHLQLPVVYSCWLRTEERDGEAPEPTKVLEAPCDHVGYVAANLAVRWHPNGERIVYLKQTGPQQHGLFELDLKTKESRQICPFTAEAIVFDWAPDQTHLVCVVGHLFGNPENDGIWIGDPEKGEWWHVPASRALAEGELPSVLESLRATQPAFTPDASRFAFVSSLVPPGPNQPARHSVLLGTLAKRRVEVLAEGKDFCSDLHWSPDGKLLGLVCGREKATLHLLKPGGELSEPINERPVRRFAGWSASGKQLAYIVPDRIPFAENEMWAFLLVPDPLARDAVYLADGTSGKQGRQVFSGMRVTFPQWSPKEEKLSVWFTFSPTYQSVGSHFLRPPSDGRRALPPSSRVLLHAPCETRSSAGRRGPALSGP